MSGSLELGENTEKLLAFPWRPNAIGSSLGCGNPYDETTGWSYEVIIEWDDPDETELVFFVTYEHYAEMEEMLNKMSDEQWNHNMPPNWIITLVNQLEAAIKAQG